MFALRTPSPACRLGDDSIGFTAGNGKDGAGDADRLWDGEEPNDDRRLCDIAGGFMGRGRVVGVPGVEGAGEAMAIDGRSADNWDRRLKSGGAGLFDDGRLAGRSILAILPCCANENWPSLVFKV